MAVLQVDYKTLKEEELLKECKKRGIVVPLNEENRLMRQEAIKALKEYDKVQKDYHERVWVVFHNSNNLNGGPYVFAAVNDLRIQAPYETKVCIPKVLLTECIDRAMTEHYTQVQDAQGNFSTVVKKIPTYPYTLLGPADMYDIEDEDESKK